MKYLITALFTLTASASMACNGAEPPNYITPAEQACLNELNKTNDRITLYHLKLCRGQV